MSSFFWWPSKPDVKPDVPETPDEANPARAAWLRAWLLLRQVDKQKLGAVIVTVPVIVFLALSGLVAWIWLALRGLVRFIRALFR